jgi:phosphinothricin acetyltransferase
MLVRPVRSNDASGLADIYNFYILNSNATFETKELASDEMMARIEDCASDGYPYFVSEDNGWLAGYAYGRRFRPREAYRHSVEISVYVRPGFENMRVGTRLYDHLIPELQARGFHTIVAGISLPNAASISLHERFGFQKAAHFREVGHKFNRWIDVGYWQLLL